MMLCSKYIDNIVHVFLNLMKQSKCQQEHIYLIVCQIGKPKLWLSSMNLFCGIMFIGNQNLLKLTNGTNAPRVQRTDVPHKPTLQLKMLTANVADKRQQAGVGFFLVTLEMPSLIVLRDERKLASFDSAMIRLHFIVQQDVLRQNSRAGKFSIAVTVGAIEYFILAMHGITMSSQGYELCKDYLTVCAFMTFFGSGCNAAAFNRLTGRSSSGII